ncbi:hypothetical protein RQN30_10185 [Arcanobacterium hippocoleae]
MMASGTLKTLIAPDRDPVTIEGKPCCANGHPWQSRTTRWRYRVRGGRHGSGWERDCLVCKRMADKARASNFAGRNQQLIVDVASSGTVWHTRF